MGGLLPKISMSNDQLIEGAKDLSKGTINDNVKAEAIDLKTQLVDQGWVNTKRKAKKIAAMDGVFMNRMIVFSWPFFSAYLLLQPWISNYANNMWYDYSSDYTVFASNSSTEILPDNGRRPGMCDTPAKYFFCTDGQNFTELALKHRGKAIGCGCGQGFLGEGLCPMTSYGYTLSDFVSTEPGIALMLGLGFFPLLGTWRNTSLINQIAKPSKFWEFVHMWSMGVFQISYILWGICSDCIFPAGHAILTVVFLGSFLFHWVITALIAIACMGAGNIESVVTLYVAFCSIAVITVGAIPRILQTLNVALGITWFWNLNYGLGSYAFWFAEACGLSLTFGAYPLILIGVHLFPALSDLNKDGKQDETEQALFSLRYQSLQEQEIEDSQKKLSAPLLP